MANFVFGWVNNVMDGTLTASTAAAGRPVTNLQVDHGAASTAWQATTTSGWFEVDAGSASALWRAFGIFRTNLTAAATVRWRLGSVAGLGSGVLYDSGVVAGGVVAGYGQSVTVMPAAIAGRYVRCDIADATNPAGFINIALAFGGPVWQAARPLAPASGFGRDSQIAEVVARGGHEFPILSWTNRRHWNLVMPGILDTEILPQAEALDVVSRHAGNVFFAPDPTSALINREAIFGRLMSTSDVGYTFSTLERRSWSARMTERL